MKRNNIIALGIFSAALAFSAAAVELDPFFVFSPRVMAQGGSFTAIASGHEALYTNPAGFYSAKGSLTLGSATVWGFLNPGSYFDTVDAAPEGEDPDVYDLMEGQAVNGFGGGASLGVSYVGRGIGIGFIASTNLLLQGETFPLGLSGTYSTTLAVVGGFARPINIGPTRLIIGGDLRPMIRAYADLDATTVSNVMDVYFDTATGESLDPELSDVFDALNGGYAYQGAGLAIDLGLKWEVGPLTAGLSVRDLFNTKLTMYRHGLGDFAESLYESASFPSNDNDGAVKMDGDYYIPMSVNFGLAFHPDLGAVSFLIDPTVHMDLVDPFGVLNDGQSPWSLLHAGAEIKTLRFITLRGGINQGYLTAGAGMKLLFLDIGASIFTRELGPYAGDQPNTGLSLEAAIRF